jgi:hypothetical protein
MDAMDGDTHARARSFDRRPLLIALAGALAAAAIWAGTSLAGGSAPSSPASPGVSNVDSGGSGGSDEDCPFKDDRSGASADV